MAGQATRAPGDAGTGETDTGDAGTGDTGTGDTGTDNTDGGEMDGGVEDDLIDGQFRLGLSANEEGLISAVLADGSLEFLTMDSLAAISEMRPVRCDLDGDGDRDLVIGFGLGSGGQIALIFLEDGAVFSTSTNTVGHARYRKRSGRTKPACGDLDGDGRGEIVVAFGTQMRGVVQVFDDVQTGFSPVASARSDSEGY